MLEPFVGKSRYANQGQRVVEGQRLMQAASDIFLGWERADGPRRRAARLLRPAAARLEGLVAAGGHGPAASWASTAGCAGGPWLARTRGRATASRSPRTSAASDAFDRAIADFAEAYADQNERDYQALKDAVESGRVVAKTGI